MPADLPDLLPVERLTLVPMDRAVSGSLLIQAAGWGNGPHLVLRDQKEGEPRTYALPVAEEGRDSFQIIPVARNSGSWLAIDSWQLLVDPSSAYAATSDIPLAGDAFISEGVPGFIARWNHGTVYIGRTGDVLAEPNWTTGHIGFRTWSIGIDVGLPGKPHILVSRTREKSSR